MFEEGEVMKSIAIIVSPDDIPELDETIIVSLSTPSDGASISPSRSSVSVMIEANDQVAGLVALAQDSRSAVVGEGDRAEFTVVRTLSALGRVDVNWTITGNTDPTAEFTATTGTAVFMDVRRGRSGRGMRSPELWCIMCGWGGI